MIYSLMVLVLVISALLYGFALGIAAAGLLQSLRGGHADD